MGQFFDIDDLVADLERIEKSLSGDGAEFFAANEARYLQLARGVAGHTLRLLRPEKEDAEAWRQNVEDFVELVFSRSLPGALEILYAGRVQFRRRGHDGNQANFTAITYADVLEWVNAGAQNGGKDLSDAELVRGRRPEQIAYDVLTAIRQHHLGIEKKDYGRITKRMEDWVDARVLSGDMEMMLDAVLNAWHAALQPVVERDFGLWVDGVVEGRKV